MLIPHLLHHLYIHTKCLSTQNIVFLIAPIFIYYLLKHANFSHQYLSTFITFIHPRHQLQSIEQMPYTYIPPSFKSIFFKALLQYNTLAQTSLSFSIFFFSIPIFQSSVDPAYTSVPVLSETVFKMLSQPCALKHFQDSLLTLNCFLAFLPWLTVPCLIYALRLPLLCRHNKQQYF